MNRILSLWWAGIVLALSAACGGDEGPQPCPVFPPCIAGSTWNAAACACLLDDEPGDAGNRGLADHATDGTDATDATDATEASDATGVDGGAEADEAGD